MGPTYIKYQVSACWFPVKWPPDHAGAGRERERESRHQLQTLTGGVYALLPQCCRLHCQRRGEEKEQKHNHTMTGQSQKFRICSMSQ